jgi:hypothetical protein
LINLGTNINSPYPDYAPVISADESILVFTSRRVGNVGGYTDSDGEYYEDIYLSKNIDWQWTKAVSIDSTSYSFKRNTQNHLYFTTAKRIEPPINTKYHDAAIGLSPTGQKLFIYKRGSIYVSPLIGDVWSKPIKMNTNINYKKSRQPSISISADENTIYFSSDRKGGYGGLDIYKSEKMPNGEWGPAQNLGPEINTPYDDDAPFIHSDGKTLFFSSKGHNTMGGYDIFKSVYENLPTGQTRSKWSEPKNIGYPINTTGDDIYYVETAKGDHAYLASIRDGGLGGMDIYLLLFPGVSLPIAEIKGKILVGDSLKPILASIKVTDKISGKEVVFTSNSLTGKYLMFLPPNRKYDLIVNAEGYQPHTEEINIPDLKTYYQLYQEIHISAVTVNKKVIGQNVTTQNVFFDVNKAIHSDSLLSIELNKTLDSIANAGVKPITSKDSIAPIRFKPSENQIDKEALYAKYINNTKKITKNESNLSQTQTFAIKGTDTTSYEKMNKIDYYVNQDSIAKIMNVSENVVANIINRPLDEALTIMSMPSNSFKKLNSLNNKETTAILQLPTSSLTRVLEMPKANIETFSKLSRETADSLIKLPGNTLNHILELPIASVETKGIISSDSLTSKLLVATQPDTNTTNVIVYTVQLGAGNMDIDYFNKVNMVKVITPCDGMKRFVVGRFITLESAIEFCKKMTELGYTDAFVRTMDSLK